MFMRSCLTSLIRQTWQLLLMLLVASRVVCCLLEDDLLSLLCIFMLFPSIRSKLRSQLLISSSSLLWPDDFLVFKLVADDEDDEAKVVIGILLADCCCCCCSSCPTLDELGKPILRVAIWISDWPATGDLVLFEFLRWSSESMYLTRPVEFFSMSSFSFWCNRICCTLGDSLRLDGRWDWRLWFSNWVLQRISRFIARILTEEGQSCCLPASRSVPDDYFVGDDWICCHPLVWAGLQIRPHLIDKKQLVWTAEITKIQDCI